MPNDQPIHETVTTPVDAIAPRLATAAGLAGSAQVVAAEVRDGELAIELCGVPLEGSE